MSSSLPPEPVLRRDAARNRERVLAAARDLLPAAGSDGPRMQDVARAAGVGQGTLYRHFPTREDLLLALYRDDVERLVAAAPDLLAVRPPIAALRAWVEELVAYGRLKRGLAGLVQASSGDAVRSRWRGPVLGALDLLVRAAQRSGELRGDVDAEDVWELLAFLWAPDVREERADRLVGLMIDGLAPGRGPRD